MTRYEEDFYAWTQEQATLLKEKRFMELDLEHLVEEIESMGRSEKRELENRLSVLIVHLLKWHYQPAKRTRSWALTILEQRKELAKLLRENPSLRPVLREEYPERYDIARIRAARETTLELDTFPENCPWTLEEILEDAEPL